MLINELATLLTPPDVSPGFEKYSISISNLKTMIWAIMKLTKSDHKESKVKNFEKSIFSLECLR